MKKQLAFLLTAGMLAAATSLCASADEEQSETEEMKEWIIATDTSFEPFEYMDTDGSFVGIDVDILTAIAEDQGFAFQLNSLGWDAAISACQDGLADGMIAGASITDERKKDGWIFSDGYFLATQCMAVPENSDIRSFDDLEEKLVGVKAETLSEEYASLLKDEYGFEIIYFEDSPTMYRAVLDEQINACFEDTPIMASCIQNGELALKILPGTESEGLPYGFAVFSEDKRELVDAFNAGLKDIMDNGVYEEIMEKYLGEEAAELAFASFYRTEDVTEALTE